MPTPNFEVPVAFREFAEKGLVQARDACQDEERGRGHLRGRRGHLRDRP
jgi:hypothetical protein